MSEVITYQGKHLDLNNRLVIVHLPGFGVTEYIIASLKYMYTSLKLAHDFIVCINVFSQIGVAFSYVLWAMSYNFTIFVVARIIGGISKGNVSLSTAVVADILPPERRGKGMASSSRLFTLK